MDREGRRAAVMGLRFYRRGRILPAWRSSLQLSAEVQELSQLADDFRDLEETFALSLSPAFSEEIKKARGEALGS